MMYTILHIPTAIKSPLFSSISKAEATLSLYRYFIVDNNKIYFFYHRYSNGTNVYKSLRKHRHEFMIVIDNV